MHGITGDMTQFAGEALAPCRPGARACTVACDLRCAEGQALGLWAATHDYLVEGRERGPVVWAFVECSRC